MDGRMVLAVEATPLVIIERKTKEFRIPKPDSFTFTRARDTLEIES